MSDAPFPAKLAAALVKAQAAAKSVAHDATNSHHRYDYTSAEAIMGEARAALNSAGLAVMQADWHVTSTDVEYTDGDGAVIKDQERSVSVRFLVIHESGETMPGNVEVPVLPEKGRPLDKALFSALTYAESYFLRGLLCLPRVSKSDDIDQRDDTQHQPRAAGRPAPDVRKWSREGKFVNKLKGRCALCGIDVEPGQGTATKDEASGKWTTRHDECPSASESVPSRAVPNVDEADCVHCGGTVEVGKGWTRDGKTIHAGCAKALKAERAAVGAAT